MSVLEVSATKRDAKGYLQKYAPKSPAALTKIPEFRHGKRQQSPTVEADSSASLCNVAIVKLRCPQSLDDITLRGVAKSFFQLRILGLVSVVVLDCGIENDRDVFEDQSIRLSEAIDSFAKPGSKILDGIAVRQQHQSQQGTASEAERSIISDQIRIEDQGRLELAIQHGLIPIIPSLAHPDPISGQKPTDSTQLALSLTKYLSGMQFGVPSPDNTCTDELVPPRKLASIERIIILDPLGGTPVPGRPGASHRFVNLEQEYESLLRSLLGPEGSPVARNEDAITSGTMHATNLRLAKEALSLLPSSSSAILTTPHAAGFSNGFSNNGITSGKISGPTSPEETPKEFGFDGMVQTRKKRNPILHNLLTDKPVFSSSLPFQRILDGADNSADAGSSSAATLVKRGMPVTIFPDPRMSHWASPMPGEPRLRLTDNCIDLQRLVHLIDDSFGRPLDVEHYLNRVKNNLAGIIIAGEYEGGAILTWETPEGLDEKTAYAQGRLVPYLDKFAVLRSRQGSGGVADIVFNAMVQDCFPTGVCWRSRKNNPVNKWYFERSSGTNKLSDSNWTMFWTTPGLDSASPILKDYESVCRKVEPSWADNKHILD